MSTFDLIFTAGLPYSQQFRIQGYALVWPTLEEFEVRSQIRSGRTETSELKGNLADYFTASIDGDDIVLDLGLTGAQTRTISVGHYDVILSDVGTTDARALRAMYGQVRIDSLVTSASDE